MREIKAYSEDQLYGLMSEMSQPKFRVKQLFEWLYNKHAKSYDEMTNLPTSLRESLKQNAPLYMPDVIEKRISKDGTRKYVIRFHDGETTEMVAMPAGERLTVCFSTQVGCAMACSFCATGKEGFKRNLLPGEMVDQVYLAQEDMGMRVSNVVAMGQGEPFLNYDNVMAALRILNSKAGMEIGARHVTVSTCGVVEGIKRWANEPEQFTLAVSLHSAVQKTRDEIMPRMANQHLKRLRTVLENYTESTNRRVTLEYIMISGVNDTSEHLDALLSFCDGMLCHVNLIPINAVEGSPLQPSSHEKMQKFMNELQRYGIEATIRNSRGQDIDGACGQLKNKVGIR